MPPVLDEEMGKQRGEATMLKTHSRSSTRLTKAELDFMGRHRHRQRTSVGRWLLPAKLLVPSYLLVGSQPWAGKGRSCGWAPLPLAACSSNLACSSSVK